MKRTIVNAFFDGSFTPSKKGGWGFMFEYKTPNDSIITFSKRGGSKTSNHQQMELTALAECLESLPFSSDITIHGDSQYVLKGIVPIDGKKPFLLKTLSKKPLFEGWIFGWQKNGWVTAGKQPVKHKELWLRIMKGCSRLTENGSIITFQWVKGHSGIEGNEIADQLAREGADS